LFDRPFYRTRQFLGAFRPTVESAERTDARVLLGERLWPLFESMKPRDQRHSLDVFHVLKDQGDHDQDLLMAALLHDVGKGRLAAANVRLWHRVVYVLLGAGPPGLLRRVANGRGGLGSDKGRADAVLVQPGDGGIAHGDQPIRVISPRRSDGHARRAAAQHRGSFRKQRAQAVAFQKLADGIRGQFASEQ